MMENNLTTEEIKQNKGNELGFAQFNTQPHLLIDIPDGGFTLSCKTSEGNLVTFAFQPYETGGPPKCVDIQHHNSGATVKNGDKDIPVQQVCCFTPGHPIFVGKLTDEKPVSLISLSLAKTPTK